MSENIFKELRLKHTKETVMRGKGVYCKSKIQKVAAPFCR